MTTTPKTLMHAAFIILLFIPGMASSQEQTETAPPPPSQTEAEPATQQTSTLPLPAQRTESSPQDAPTTQGQVLIPAEQPIETGAAPPVEALPTDAAGLYIIKKGDTLWDISNSYLKDPFLWPFIWKENPSIANPDLIYPGNKLAIPSLAPIERALQAPAAEGPKEQLIEKQAAVKEKEPERKEVAGTENVEKPAPVMEPVQPAVVEQAPPKKSRFALPEAEPKPLIDKYAMLRYGFMDGVENEGSIVGAYMESKSILGYDDIVYVKIRAKESADIGDKFLIYKTLNDVKHPKTGKNYGKLIKGLGILQITAKDSPEVFTARITLSFSEIEERNLLTKYQEPMLIYPSTEKKVKDISGYILEVTDKRSINAQTDVVYLDRGRAEGVELGDAFEVFSDMQKRNFPRKKIGEVQVFLLQEHSSTAIVRKSSEEMIRGNAVAFKK